MAFAVISASFTRQAVDLATLSLRRRSVVSRGGEGREIRLDSKKKLWYCLSRGYPRKIEKREEKKR